MLVIDFQGGNTGFIWAVILSGKSAFVLQVILCMQYKKKTMLISRTLSIVYLLIVFMFQFKAKRPPDISLSSKYWGEHVYFAYLRRGIQSVYIYKLDLLKLATDNVYQ